MINSHLLLIALISFLLSVQQANEAEFVLERNQKTKQQPIKEKFVLNFSKLMLNKCLLKKRNEQINDRRFC